MFGWKKNLSALPAACPAVAYRLLAWPELPEHARKVNVYRALSRMSLGPVSLEWFVAHSGLRVPQADALLNDMVGHGQLEIIDLKRFQGQLPLRS